MGLNLHDYIAGKRPWGQLERVLERLPRHSNYKAALDDDDEFAALVARLDLPERPAKVPLVGYDDVLVRLDNLYDVMSNVVEVLIAVNSSKGRGGRRPIRAPRPENARERLKRAQAEERLSVLEQKLTGGG
jgi:hypothetical protein